MKKYLLPLLTCATAVALTSCLSDGDDTIMLVGDKAYEEPPTEELSESAYTAKLFSVGNATFNTGSIPEANGGSLNFDINDRSLPNGMNFITINTNEDYDYFLIGVNGLSGYWKYVPENNDKPYIIPLYFGGEYAEDINVVVIGVKANGTSDGGSKPVTYEAVQSGELNINLTFTTPKDVDLHLITPSGTRIYYGHRGGSTIVNGVELVFGLDHDSNAGCNIDNLNNENIVIPEALIEPGVYKVFVNMYSNCDTSVDCRWSLVVRYKGALVSNLMSDRVNPTSGIYLPTCDNDDMTEVMEFQITSAANSASQKAPSFQNMKVTPRPLTRAEKDKIEADPNLEIYFEN